MDLFPGHIAHKILAIPIPRLSSQYTLIWPYTKLGTYTTKSGNHFLYNSQHNSDKQLDSTDELYKRLNIWALIRELDVPEKIKMFLWKCAWNILPLRKSRSVRIPSISPLYAISQEREEDDTYSINANLLSLFGLALALD